MASAYQTARPFPHAVFDWVIDQKAVIEVEKRFPYPDQSWWKYENPLERKFAKDNLSDEPSVIHGMVATLQSRFFTDFLEKLTGIPNLIVDQTMRGGGLHCSARGGKLDLHIDHNVSPRTGLDRRLNVILYLNSRWEDEWNGQLELWEDLYGKPHKCARKIKPTIGRLVIFNTNEVSWHGHPDALECPEGITRKSIALYYWTNGRPENERAKSHSTIYAGRPGDVPDQKLEELRAARAKGRLTT